MRPALRSVPALLVLEAAAVVCPQGAPGQSPNILFPVDSLEHLMGRAPFRLPDSFEDMIHPMPAATGSAGVGTAALARDRNRIAA